MNLKQRFWKARELESELNQLELTGDIPKDYRVGRGNVNQEVIWALDQDKEPFVDMAVSLYRGYLEAKKMGDSKEALTCVRRGLYYQARKGVGFLKNIYWDESGYEWSEDGWKVDYELFKRLLGEDL